MIIGDYKFRFIISVFNDKVCVCGGSTIDKVIFVALQGFLLFIVDTGSLGHSKVAVTTVLLLI